MKRLLLIASLFIIFSCEKETDTCNCEKVWYSYENDDYVEYNRYSMDGLNCDEAGVIYYTYPTGEKFKEETICD